MPHFLVSLVFVLCMFPWKALACILCWPIDRLWQIHPLTSWCDAHSPLSVMLTLDNSECTLWNMNFQEFVQTTVSVLGALLWVRQQGHSPRRWPAAARGGGWTRGLVALREGAGGKGSEGVLFLHREDWTPPAPEFPLSASWTASFGWHFRL